MPPAMPAGGAMPVGLMLGGGRMLGFGSGSGVPSAAAGGGGGDPGWAGVGIGVRPPGTAVPCTVFPRRAFRSIFGFFLSSAIGSSSGVSRERATIASAKVAGHVNGRSARLSTRRRSKSERVRARSRERAREDQNPYGSRLFRSYPDEAFSLGGRRTGSVQRLNTEAPARP